MKAHREADLFGIAKNFNQAISQGDLSDTQWEKWQPLLPSQKPTKGRPNINHRQLIGVNIGLVESREGITPRPSQLELYVKLSPYTAPEYLGFFSPAHVYQLVTALMNYL